MPIGVNNDDSLFVVAALCRMGIEMRPRAEKTYTPKRKTPAFGEGLSFGRTGRIVFNRHCLWRLNPAGAPLRYDGPNAPLVAFVEQRLLSKPNPPKPKNPPKGEFLILVGPGGFEPPTSTMST